MQTYRHHGVSHGLYAGTVPAVVASVAENSVLFTAYSGFQNLITFVMEIDKVCELSVLANACAGSMAAVLSTLALCPTELVKCKLQAIQEVTFVLFNCTITNSNVIVLDERIFGQR